MNDNNEWFHLGEPRRSQRPEINLSQNDREDQVICCGYVPVVLEKSFGPLIFADIRIVADADTCEWVIQRETIKTGEWVEVARIHGQKEDDFTDDSEII